MKHTFPYEVIEICHKLHKAGFEAYVVGGAIRDIFLGRIPKDYDITTDARPEEVQEVFEKTIPVGIEFGTVVVADYKEPMEVTTYRADGKYTNGRQPDSVKFSDSIQEDLSRRDLTMNAIAYDPIQRKLIDPFDGQKAIKKKLIKCVGNPKDRFSEDYLRMLRAVRFAALDTRFSLGEVEKNTIIELAKNITRISKERIREEILKIMKYPYPAKSIDLMRDTGLLKFVLPDLVPCVGVEQGDMHAETVYEHCRDACQYCPSSKPLLRLAALLHDVGKPHTKELKEDRKVTFYEHESFGADLIYEWMTRMTFSTDEKRYVTDLIRYHMYRFEDNLKKKTVRRWLRKVGDLWPDLIQIRMADRAGNRAKDGKARNTEAMRKLIKKVHEIKVYKEPLQVKDLAISGHDVMDLGVKEGPEVGLILKALFEIVLDDPTKNDREFLLEKSKELFRQTQL